MELDCLAFLFGMVAPLLLYFMGNNYKIPPLANPKHTKVILLTTTLIALIGLSTILYTIKKPNFYLFLVCPLYSFAVYRWMLLWFRDEYGRYPKVTYRERDPKLGWDELFQFVYLMLTTVGPILLLAAFYP